jgi:hypothetical protein
LAGGGGGGIIVKNSDKNANVLGVFYEKKAYSKRYNKEVITFDLLIPFEILIQIKKKKGYNKNI